MVTFTRTGSTVFITVITGVVGLDITTEYQCNSALYAILLRDKLAETHMRKIEEFAAQNYEAGFTDHKKRKQRREFHPASI